MSDVVVRSPWDGSEVGRYSYATAEETDAALTKLEAGRAVFAELSAHARAQILHRFADLVDAEADSLARLVTQEIGKTLRDSQRSRKSLSLVAAVLEPVDRVL